MKNLKLHVVDSFAEKPFTGNPAGVVLVDRPLADATLQKLALEMNISETAFLERRAEGLYSIRWFTPWKEVDLCGHATLAAAHRLWESGYEQGEEIRFQCSVGDLRARRVGSNRTCLDFPVERAAEAAELKGPLAEILGVPILWAGKNRMDYIVEIGTEAELMALQPDFVRMAGLPCRGLLVTVRSQTSEFHFKSRTFFPALGVNEDPVCGSAHCCFAPYWAEKLGLKEMTAYQASPRGGVVQMILQGDRVQLIGSAVTVSAVEFLVPLS